MSCDRKPKVALLTPIGRAAVATLVVEGPGAAAAIETHFRSATGVVSFPLRRILFGHWSRKTSAGEESAAGEDLIVCRTDEDQIEIHCHGGRAASAAIIDDLTQLGCEEVDWRTWHAQKTTASTIEREAEVAMTEATTLRVARILNDQRQGALRSAIQQVQELIQNDRLRSATTQLDALLTTYCFGKHLRDPWHVVIAGEPNVGKSSLINAIAGYARAIVHHHAGTTRDVLSISTAIDGWPVRFSDTAGLRETEDQIESAGIKIARQTMDQSDLVIWVSDQPDQIIDPAMASRGPIRVLNKTDAIEPPEDPNRFDLLTSAKDRTGIEPLLEAVLERLVPVPPEFGRAVVFNERQKLAIAEAHDWLEREEVDRAKTQLGALLS